MALVDSAPQRHEKTEQTSFKHGSPFDPDTSLSSFSLQDMRDCTKKGGLPEGFPLSSSLLSDAQIRDEIGIGKLAADGLVANAKSESSVSGTLKTGGSDNLPGQPAEAKDVSHSGWDKVMNTDEVKDAQEFQKKFGDNPNSPEAIAWIEKKIREHAQAEAKESEESAERRGLAPVGDAGYSYGQMLLLHISAQNTNFNPDNVHWSYFQHGTVGDPSAGWHRMRGFKQEQ